MTLAAILLATANGANMSGLFKAATVTPRTKARLSWRKRPNGPLNPASSKRAVWGAETFFVFLFEMVRKWVYYFLERPAMSQTEVKNLRGRNGKTAQLIEQLQGEILRGDRPPGSRLPTFAEMRSQFGVAVATSDQIYSALEQAGLVRRENGKGLFVRDVQRRAHTGIIGFTGKRPFGSHCQGSPYHGHMIEGIQDAALAAGYEVLLLRPESRICWEQVDGVLVSHGYSSDIWDRFPPGMPFVSMVMEWTDHPSILSEDYPAMKEMTNHLLDLGHRRIGLFSLSQSQYSQQRNQAYSDSLTEAGLVPEAAWQRDLRFQEMTGTFETLGYVRMKQWLAEDWASHNFTALMAYNDDVAYGAIRALREAGYSVPQDVSVTGFDGVPAGHGPQYLSTVKVPLQAIARTAFKGLCNWIERDEVPQSARLRSHFMAGQTTGPCPGKP